MDACSRPEVEYPCRVPMKIIGRMGVLDPAQVEILVMKHLGPQLEGDRGYSANQKGAFISYTFWVTLPNAEAERPLREAIHALPGCMMQL